MASLSAVAKLSLSTNEAREPRFPFRSLKMTELDQTLRFSFACLQKGYATALEVSLSRCFVAGGVGFIGSHITRRLLEQPDAQVAVNDNFSSECMWHLPDDRRLVVVQADMKQRRLVDRSDHRLGRDLPFCL